MVGLRVPLDLLNVMNHKIRICVALLACLFALAACRSPSSQNAVVSAETESGFHAPVSERPKQNVRKLRSSLPGKKMRDVVRVLGRPSQVFTLEERETWKYENAAYDPVTGRRVRSLDIFFVDRVVASVNFSY